MKTVGSNFTVRRLTAAERSEVGQSRRWIASIATAGGLVLAYGRTLGEAAIAARARVLIRPVSGESA